MNTQCEPDAVVKKINPAWESKIAKISILTTLVLFTLLFSDFARSAYHAYIAGKPRLIMEAALFATCMFFMCYGNLLYQICLFGYYQRRKQYRPASYNALYQRYIQPAPSLSVLVPSYKEEKDIIWQTMISAALAEYPHKNVVLLIDDPHTPKLLEDKTKLEQARNVVNELQALFSAHLSSFATEQENFLLRGNQESLHKDIELNRLSMLYDEAAGHIEKIADNFSESVPLKLLPYNKKFFVKDILLAPALKHRAMAIALRKKIGNIARLEKDFFEIHYARLASLFNVTFSSFERKKYENLSHEANKAMNLNSYIALVGKHWREVEMNGKRELHETTRENADFSIPAADYIDTLDADTVMLSEYALRLIHIMEAKDNERLAVIQSPCSTIPGSSNELERVAGSCIDVQFQTHQGYTAWNASSWVGANAMLRYKALEEIKEIYNDNGKKVAIYIQDRTVIEDTESTIDLVEKGWKLYNYPERMTFSPTPPDFGSLLIQRRRWSNGGLIILPKLISYIAKSPKSLELLKELFMRFHYLTSTTSVCIAAAILFFYPFGEISSSKWIVVSSLPCLLLYSRDLKNCGYKYSDSLRTAALFMMLLPIMAGGVLKQFQQMATGEKIPFGRTPKITGRTAAPALYCLLEIALTLYCVAITLRNVFHNEWINAAFSSFNSVLMVYAVIGFIGVRATFEDIAGNYAVSVNSLLRRIEEVPLALRRLFLPSPAIR